MKSKTSSVLATLFIAIASIGVAAATTAAHAAERINNVVLVHGGFVDGSGWEAVYKSLKAKGYNVAIVQNSTHSLADDVAMTKAVIDAQDGPVVLVGHSYGGVVVSEAGNDPKVSRLVYIAAFQLDAGESIKKMFDKAPPGGPVPPILPPSNGYLMLDKAKFAASFAADVKPERAAFLASAQVPWGVDAFTGEVTTASWHSKPSWYLLTQDDKMIPPDLQHFMSKRAGATVVETRGSHAVYESRPASVAAIIEKAATSTQ